MFELMVDFLARPMCHEAFYKKYASKKFMKGIYLLLLLGLTRTNRPIASLITRQWAKKNAPMFGIMDTKMSVDDLSLLD